MGYCISVMNSDFTILAEHLDAAYAEACALNRDPSAEKHGGRSDGGARVESWFSWVSSNYDETCKDMFEVMAEWRYYCIADVAGNLVMDHFTGEKLGSEDQLFNRIAPYVVSGSFIEYLGEDGTQWRYVFKDGEFREATANIVWSE